MPTLIDGRYYSVPVFVGDEIVTLNIDMNEPWSGNVPIESVLQDPEQPRKLFAEEPLKTLQKSITASTQAQGITAIPHSDPSDEKIKWKINDGERRYRSIKRNGARSIWIVYNPNINEKNNFLMQVVSNFARQGHTHYEVANAIDRLMQDGKSPHTIGELLGFHPITIVQKHSLLKLHPDLLPLIDEPTPKEKRIPIEAALRLANLSHEEQVITWEKVKDKRKKERHAHHNTSRACRCDKHSNFKKRS